MTDQEATVINIGKGGKTVTLDNVTPTSRRGKLTGKPDRIIRSGGTLDIEDCKSARKVQPWHRAQMGVYFLQAEDPLGIRLSHGILEQLRAWVLGIEETIRQRWAVVNQPIQVNKADASASSPQPVSKERS